jgi:hypothetical protein
MYIHIYVNICTLIYYEYTHINIGAPQSAPDGPIPTTLQLLPLYMYKYIYIYIHI